MIASNCSSSVAEATRRGDTLVALAKVLGVSYARLAQWRRNESSIAAARSAVLERAAGYLGLPHVLVLVLAGVINQEHFVWPESGPLGERVARELKRLRQDTFLGPFVPKELDKAAPSVQLFVAFLYHELSASAQSGVSACRWLSALHRSTIGNVQAQVELEALRAKSSKEAGLF
jgi:transcriptional regulator with XRE-family HTH domain